MYMKIQNDEQKQIPKEEIRYCLYARKSTESDEHQALSINSQINEMQSMAERDGLTIVDIKKESHSAKNAGGRPVFNELIEEIKSGKYTGIICWHPDRISRNAGDLGRVVDLMDQGLLHEIRTYSQTFTNNPNEKFLFMILGSQAKLENDTKSINIKRGLRARVEAGLWPVCAPTGYLNSKDKDKSCVVEIDPLRAPVIKQIFEKIAHEGKTGRQIYIWLKDELDFRTKNGKHLSLGNIYIIIKNTFYYGDFEYPQGSGNWYKGVHKPIISKELFEQVQQNINLNQINASKKRSKEFAFTKLMTCGLCGSGITAEEKFKPLKDGGTNRYVYYRCTKGKDPHCTNGSTSEVILIDQLKKLIDEVSLSKLGMKKKLESEIDRYSAFRYAILGLEDKELEEKKKVDMKNYAKYILEKGTVFEKRELMRCLKSKIQMNNKTIKLY